MTKPGSNILEIPELLTRRMSRRIIFEFEGLTVEKANLFEQPIYIPAEDLQAIRLGIQERRVAGRYFVTARHFVIELKYGDNCITNISLNSYCGLRKQTYSGLWYAIIEQLSNYYFSSHLNLYLELYRMRQSFALLGLKFGQQGISWDKSYYISWDMITLSNYPTYFVLHHKQNSLHSKSFNFLKDWNAYLLQNVLKCIVEEQHKMLSS